MKKNLVRRLVAMVGICAMMMVSAGMVFANAEDIEYITMFADGTVEFMKRQIRKVGSSASWKMQIPSGFMSWTRAGMKPNPAPSSSTAPCAMSSTPKNQRKRLKWWKNP